VRRVVDKRGYMGGPFRRQHPYERNMTFLSSGDVVRVDNSMKTPSVPRVSKEKAAAPHLVKRSYFPLVMRDWIPEHLSPTAR
jgi:hypothetical protein